ncbi:colorectal mutant cancer protein isoform X2 [Culicoides brevitarsis]|uniref:colorectal mutant cancer protein isoform X2 n=1 Tax=Culicoides brevitarsis TaxID=469753 RepID=UPI00307B710E
MQGNHFKHEFGKESPNRRAKSSTKHNKNTDTSQSFQSWDSGVARDLSPLRPVVATDGGESMLDLASKFHVAALSALNNEVLELRSKLHRAELEKDALKCQLQEAFNERERSQRRFDSLAAANEGRITEMHVLIVELQKKLKAQQENAILEEPECEGSVSELSFQEGSVYNSDVEGSHHVPDHHLEVEDDANSAKSTSPCSPLPPMQMSHIQMEALQEEILHLRAQVALLQSQLATQQSPRDDQSVHDNKSNYTSDDLCETADIFDVENDKRETETPKKSPGELAGVSKSTERVKLRRNVEETAEIETSPIVEDEKTTIQQLQTDIQRLKVQNSVVTLTLAESKEHCEQLYLLCGKYESNAIALQQALNCSDRAIEAYDVMLALLESKLSLLEKAPSANESRKAAETVARHLLNRLSDDTMTENSSGPWQEPVVLQSTDDLKPWTDDDDLLLRKHVSKLKGQRFTTQNTTVTLEPPFSYGRSGKEELPSPMGSSRGRSRNDSRRIDLETAVLLQELNDYKSRVESSEREKMDLYKQLGTLQESLLHLQGQLHDSEALLAMATKDRSSFSEAEYAVNIERELVEALSRESRLKSRIQGLVGSLEAATKSKSNEKFSKIHQSHINELRQTNMGLDKSLEKCKKKYQAKMNKLEQQLLQLSLANNNNLTTNNRDDRDDKSTKPDTQPTQLKEI